jgi:hypothetical protein
MPRVTLRATLALSLAAALLALACGRGDDAATPPVSAPAPATGAFRVVSLELGTAIDDAKAVREPKTTFAPSDTIYASVKSEGAAPSVTLAARWIYGDDQLVSESTQQIAPSAGAMTEFHLARPSGWPAGRYRIELSADGAPAAAREFDVR